MKKSNVVLGIMAGAAVGAMVGILMAPDKGYKTRKKLYKKGGVAFDEVKDKAYILAAYANEVSNDMDRAAEKIDDAIEQITREAAGKVGDAISKFSESKRKGS